MIAYTGLRVVDWCLGIDGEPYVGDQDQAFEDQQRAQESFDQGKYNLGSSLLPIHLKKHTYIYISYACFHLVDLSKIIDVCYLDPLLPTWYAFGVVVLVLVIIHDLVRWLIAMQWT